MKPYSILLLSLITFGAACRPSDRYELMKTNNGIARLDRKTGTVDIIDPKNATGAPVRIASSSEFTGYDVNLSKVKTLADFILPETNRRVRITLESRWQEGRVDYRVTVVPALEAMRGLNLLSQDRTDILKLKLVDSDGFTIKKVTPLFWDAHVVRGADKKSRLVEERHLNLSRSDYAKIANVVPIWSFSEKTKQLLAAQERPGSLHAK